MMKPKYKVEKLDGRIVDFDINKIKNAISKCGVEDNLIDNISSQVFDIIDSTMDKLDKFIISVEQIHHIVEETLCNNKLVKEYKEYSSYRKMRNNIREKKSDLIKVINDIGVSTTRDNGNVGNNFSAKLLQMASAANKLANLAEMPKNMAKLHENGDLHYHDLDSFQIAPNCLHNDTLQILLKGFNTGYGTINPPKRITSAAQLSCIILQSAQN